MTCADRRWLHHDLAPAGDLRLDRAAAAATIRNTLTEVIRGDQEQAVRASMLNDQNAAER
jgi:hypothetical protein